MQVHQAKPLWLKTVGRVSMRKKGKYRGQIRITNYTSMGIDSHPPRPERGRSDHVVGRHTIKQAESFMLTPFGSLKIMVVSSETTVKANTINPNPELRSQLEQRRARVTPQADEL
jgi:hypothetical protein